MPPVLSFSQLGKRFTFRAFGLWPPEADAVVGGAPDSFVPFKPGTKVGRREGRGPFRFKGEGRGPFQW